MDIAENVKVAREKSVGINHGFIIAAVVIGIITGIAYGMKGLFITLIILSFVYMLVKLVHFSIYGIFFLTYVESFLLICDNCESGTVRVNRSYNGLDENNNPVYINNYKCGNCDHIYEKLEDNLVRRKARLDSVIDTILASD